MCEVICFDDERVSGESDSTADSILIRPCDQMEEGAWIRVAKSVFFSLKMTCSDSRGDRGKTVRQEAQTLGTNMKCVCQLTGCGEATVKAVSIIKALGRCC